MMDFSSIAPVVSIILLYAAIAGAITFTIRKTLYRRCTRVAMSIWKYDIVKKAIPCIVAFLLMMCSIRLVLSWVGLTVAADRSVLGISVVLSIASGFVSGLAYRWILNQFNRRGMFRG